MAKRKKASWVGPANPVDPSSGILRPTGELSAEARAESEKTSPRPKVKPQDKSKTVVKRVKKIDPKTGGSYEADTELKPYKEPVQKRKKPKVATVEKLKEAGVRPPTTGELGKKITAVSTAPKPKRQRKPRTKTKSGKKIDPKTGKIRAPRKGEAAKIDGQVVRVDDSNIAEATKAARTTILPAAGPEVVEGATPQRPRGTGRVTRVSGGLRGPKGGATSFKEISDLVTQAKGHLTQMTLTRNTPAFHEHHESFNLVHAKLEKKAPAAHTILGIMRHLTVNPTPQVAEHFDTAEKALGDTLTAYKAMDTHNRKSAQSGYQERLRRIKAEREGSSE